MSRPRSPHTGDLDSVLRDDLALEQIGRGRRPRGADNALKLLCTIAEDVEVKVPRRRTRGSRLTRGLLATTVAATVLGATGVAAAEPGGTSNLAFWTPRPGNHIQAADRSLTEAQRSLDRGDTAKAYEQLEHADKQMRRAGSSTYSAALQKRASKIHEQSQYTNTPRPLPTTGSAGPGWSWAWGIPGGGPGWQPEKAPYTKKCLLVICRYEGSPTSVPQQTPGTSSSKDDQPGLLFRRSNSTATPTTPGASNPSPSSSASPSGDSPIPTVRPSEPTESGEEEQEESSSASSSPDEDGSSSSSTETAEPRPSSSSSG